MSLVRVRLDTGGLKCRLRDVIEIIIMGMSEKLGRELQHVPPVDTYWSYELI